jgi:YggT family protein
MAAILAYALYRFLDLLTFLLLARAVLSWFVNPYSRSGYGALYKINAILIQLTEPMVAPCRRILRNFNTGMFDFSILAAMLLLMLIRNLIRILF